MAQRWKALTTEANKNCYITELKNHSDYNMAQTSNLVERNNLHGNFVIYMPDTYKFIAATTSIKFHDCYREGSTGYAHASFAFVAPGYLAGFPISFGFAGVNKANSVWVIGQKQVYVQSDRTNTSWLAAFECGFGWPSEPCGIVPFIAVGGVPFYQRYTGTAAKTSVTYYTDYLMTATSSYTDSTLKSSNIANDTNGDEFASNNFNAAYDNWDYVDSGWSASPSLKSAKCLCPVNFSNWKENANSSFMGGWKNRQSSYGEGELGGKYTGVGTVFCTSSDSTYGSALVYANAGYHCAVKVYVYDSAGKPQGAKEVYVYDSNGKPKRAKHLYVYNSSGVPVQVF